MIINPSPLTANRYGILTEMGMKSHLSLGLRTSIVLNKVERDFQISKALFNKSERTLDNGLDHRFK